MPNGSVPAEVDEQPTEVLRVLLHPVVEGLDVLAVEIAQYVLLELSGPLAGDDLDEGGLLGHRLVDDLPQGPVDVRAAVVDVVQVELQLHAPRPRCPALAVTVDLVALGALAAALGVLAAVVALAVVALAVVAFAAVLAAGFAVVAFAVVAFTGAALVAALLVAGAFVALAAAGRVPRAVLVPLPAAAVALVSAVLLAAAAFAGAGALTGAFARPP